MCQSYELTEHAQKRLDERNIPLRWVEKTLCYPQRVEPDKEDPELLNALGTIPEFGDRVL